jgi:3-phenylpropionate/cinnamic acid dioxygenase small subunit
MASTDLSDRPDRALPVCRQDVDDFVHREADLADANCLREWLGLWNPDRACYVVPDPRDDGSKLHVAIIRDDYGRLCERVQRLTGGLAHAQDPVSLVSRVIGRITAESGPAGSVVATSKFLCVEIRPDRDVIWAGTTRHTLARGGRTGELELWRKEVRLVNAAKEMFTLAFII